MDHHSRNVSATSKDLENKCLDISDGLMLNPEREEERFEQRRSSRPPNPQLGGAQVSLKLLFGYVNIFSSADLFTTDLNCRKKVACDIISECNVILSRRI